MNFPNCIQCCATICNGLHRMARAARKQSRQLKRSKKMPDFLKESQEQISSVSVTHYLNNVILQFLLTVLPFFAFGVVITILVSIIQVGFKISTKPMAPKLSKFNPINGFKRYCQRTPSLSFLSLY